MSTISFHSYSAPLPALGTEVMTVILENFSIVMIYAFSQEALVHFYDAHFHGDFKFLQRAFSETPQRKATRALVELAGMYRSLDDVQDITGYVDRDGKARFGDLYMSLIHTCELCGVNAFEYLTELQRHAPELAKTPGEWLPWTYQETLARARSSGGPAP